MLFGFNQEGKAVTHNLTQCFFPEFYTQVNVSAAPIPAPLNLNKNKGNISDVR